MKERAVSNSRHYLIACVLSLCVGLAAGASAWPSDARGPAPKPAGGREQDSEKVLKKDSFSPSEPVRILKVKNKKGEVPLGKKFRGDADAGWLRGLTITVENTSGRTITYVNVTLMFPPEVNHSTQDLAYGFDFMFGVSPQHPHYEESRRRQPDRVLRHGERLDLTLSDGEYEHIQKALRFFDYPPDLREAFVRLYEVGFDDGTGWMGGNTYDFRGHSQLLKKPHPPPKSGRPEHSFLKTSYPAIKPIPAQSRCGGAIHRFFTDSCSISGCLRPQDRVDYLDPIRSDAPRIRTASGLSQI
jgi:hypothetical protein